MFYEVSIPLANLDISAADIETNGIGILKVSTFGTSGMDCLPYDLSMADNAAKPYSKDASTSAEKEDEDHITVPMARIGKAFTPGTVQPTTPVKPTQPVTQPTQPATQPTQPATQPTQPATQPAETLLGDVDKDGVVTIIDVTWIQRFLLDVIPPVFDEAAADIDGDGEVTIVDATWLQRALLGAQVPYDIKIVDEW